MTIVDKGSLTNPRQPKLSQRAVSVSTFVELSLFLTCVSLRRRFSAPATGYLGCLKKTHVLRTHTQDARRRRAPHNTSTAHEAHQKRIPRTMRTAHEALKKRAPHHMGSTETGTTLRRTWQVPLHLSFGIHHDMVSIKGVIAPSHHFFVCSHVLCSLLTSIRNSALRVLSAASSMQAICCCRVSHMLDSAPSTFSHLL